MSGWGYAWSAVGVLGFGELRGTCGFGTESRNLWRVGRYNEIKGIEAGLDAHHVGQAALMKRLIPQYDRWVAPAILVPKYHTLGARVVSRNMTGITTARQLLARDIFELRRVYPSIPNSAIEELIWLNKQIYPGAFGR